MLDTSHSVGAVPASGLPANAARSGPSSDSSPSTVLQPHDISRRRMRAGGSSGSKGT